MSNTMKNSSEESELSSQSSEATSNFTFVPKEKSGKDRMKEINQLVDEYLAKTLGSDVEKNKDATQEINKKFVEYSKDLATKFQAKVSELDEKFSSRVEDLDKQFKEKYSELDANVDKKIIQESKKNGRNNIETLGIFVALFTFVSIEFQAFRIYQDPFTIAGLTLILLGVLLIFISVLDIILNRESSIFRWNKICIGISVLSIIVGILFFTQFSTRDYVKDLANINDDILGLKKTINLQSKEAVDASIDLNVLQERLNDYNYNSQSTSNELEAVKEKIMQMESDLRNLINKK